MLKWKPKSFKLFQKLKNETRVNENLNNSKMKFNPTTNVSIWRKTQDRKTFKSLGLDKTANKDGFVFFDEKYFILDEDNDSNTHTHIMSCDGDSPGL